MVVVVLKHACKLLDIPPMKTWNLSPLPLNLGGSCDGPIGYKVAEVMLHGFLGFCQCLMDTLSPCERSCHPEVAVWRCHMGRPGRPARGPQTSLGESFGDEHSHTVSLCKLIRDPE